MIVLWIHFRRFDRIRNLSGKVLDSVDPTLKFPKPLKLLVFMLRDEVPANAAVTGDSHRFTLRLFLIATEILGKFTRRDCHVLNPRLIEDIRNIRNLRKLRNSNPVVLIIQWLVERVSDSEESESLEIIRIAGGGRQVANECAGDQGALLQMMIFTACMSCAQRRKMGRRRQNIVDPSDIV
jgi:hypothetical protein